MNETMREVPGATLVTVMVVVWGALLAAAPFIALLS